MNPGPLSSLAKGLTRREHLRRFVPAHAPVRAEQVETLQRFMDESRRLFVLTGAGISTESGIPDYRSEEVGVFARTTDRPVRYQEFVTSASARQRYWARNFVGWPGFSSSQPNASHRVLSRWERVGRLHWLVTQNVDRLHQKAGSEKVTELHGCAHRVTCLSCSSLMPRDQLQQLILKYNADWKAEAVDVSPDGDVQLSARQVEGFRVPPCPECNGILKPDVVFFGDNVKRNTVDFIFQKLKECDSVLVVGSSLQVYSGFRFIVTAVEKGKPTAIVNIGPTRADALTQLKVSACSTEILTRMIVH